MTTSAAPRTILYAEQEHGGIRLAVFLTLFVAYVLGFLVVSWLIRNFAPDSIVDYATFISCVAALPLALLAIWLVENTLKNVWHSGLTVQLDPAGVYVEDRRDGGRTLTASDRPVITWAKPFSQLNWYFRLSGYPRGGRERRVSDKWLCVCTELQQDDRRLSVYAFMPPETAATWIDGPTRASFHILNPGEVYETGLRSRVGPPSRPTIPTALLHSKDGRYWLAERRRWEMGIELTPEDFALIMETGGTAGTQQPATAVEYPLL
jgi:hypothetical protein